MMPTEMSPVNKAACGSAQGVVCVQGTMVSWISGGKPLSRGFQPLKSSSPPALMVKFPSSRPKRFQLTTRGEKEDFSF